MTTTGSCNRWNPTRDAYTVSPACVRLEKVGFLWCVTSSVCVQSHDSCGSILFNFLQWGSILFHFPPQRREWRREDGGRQVHHELHFPDIRRGGQSAGTYHGGLWDSGKERGMSVYVTVTCDGVYMHHVRAQRQVEQGVAVIVRVNCHCHVSGSPNPVLSIIKAISIHPHSQPPGGTSPLVQMGHLSPTLVSRCPPKPPSSTGP